MCSCSKQRCVKGKTKFVHFVGEEGYNCVPWTIKRNHVCGIGQLGLVGKSFTLKFIIKKSQELCTLSSRGCWPGGQGLGHWGFLPPKVPGSKAVRCYQLLLGPVHTEHLIRL